MTTSNDCTRIELDGEMTIYSAARLQERLVSGMHSGTETQLDLSRVSDVDLSGLQLLLHAHHEAAAHGGSLTIVSASPAVQEMLKLCGLADLFGIGLEAKS